MITILTIIENCLLYEKLGLRWWQCLIPFYNTYKLYEAVYGNGWRFLLLLIPFYGIYLAFKTNFMLSDAFGKGTAFGIGMLILMPIFYGILAFGKSEPNYEIDIEKTCVPAVVFTLLTMLPVVASVILFVPRMSYLF